MVALVTALLVGAMVMFMPAGSGGLVISVSGPGGTAISGVSVLVDGREVCVDSPCKVDDLKPGSYVIKARAKGFAEMTGRAQEVGSDAQRAINIELVVQNNGS